MKISFEFQINDELAKEMIQNFPEYTPRYWCKFEKVDYDNGILTLSHFDEIDGSIEETRKINVDDINKIIPKLLNDILDNKIFPYGIKTVDDFNDPGNWDSEMADIVLQYVFFGELIYG